MDYNDYNTADEFGLIFDGFVSIQFPWEKKIITRKIVGHTQLFIAICFILEHNTMFGFFMYASTTIQER